MGDRVLKNRPDFVHRAALCLGDFAQRTFIARFVGKAQSVVQNMRRDAIGVRDKADGHPATNRLVTVRSPVNNSAHCVNGSVYGEASDQQKQDHDQPLLPAKAFNSTEEFEPHRLGMTMHSLDPGIQL